MTDIVVVGPTFATVPVVPRDTLNASAVSAGETQQTIAAENAPLRVIYGQVRVGPQVASVLAYNGGIVILAVWGHGEVDSIVSMTIDDKAVAAGVTATHYTGAAGQTANATMIAAWAAQTVPQTYTDALPGICYSVVFVPAGASSGFPRLNAVIKGLKVWNGSAVAWTDNPAWCLADFLGSTLYGMGATVDLTSAASVAGDCDVLAGGTEKMRTLNLALESVQPVTAWVETLRTYAGCWVVPGTSGWKLVSDKAGSSAASYSHTAGTIGGISNIKKRGVQSMPTVMTVTYSDTSVLPYRDASVTVYAAGVLAGTTPRRESSVSLPGVNRYSQAYREATERLNKLLLNDLSMTLGVFDDALKVEVGDIVDVTHPLGFSAKLMRVMGITGDYGRFTLSLVEYDPAVFAATVMSSPTWADTSLPNPSAPPAVTGLTMAEEVYQLQDGTSSSRWRVTWSAATYPFLDHYRCELWIGATLIQASRATTTSWPTPAVQENQTYTAKVAAVSTIGATGTWATQSGTALGKYLIPGDVPSVAAFEAGGRVYVSWLPAVDIDIWRYEVRYGVVGGSWAAATLLDRVDAIRLNTDQMPTGTWTVYVKALDSVRQYSTNAASVNVTVTSDASAFLVGTYQQTAPTLTNMVEYSLARDDANRYFESDDGVALSTKFSTTDGAGNFSAYAATLATYHNSMTSTWLGESEDFGLLMGGNWSGNASVSDISGAHLSYLGTSVDGSAWTYNTGLSVKTNARFARMKHESLTTATLLVTVPDATVRIDAIPREEVGTATSISTSPKTVFMSNDYAVVKTANVIPQGTTAANGVLDNIGHNLPNVADKGASVTVTGNTVTKTAVASWDSVRARHPVPSTGKWYWEVKVDNGGTYPNTVIVGFGTRTFTLNGFSGSVVGDLGVSYYGNTGNKFVNGVSGAYGATFTTGDVIGIAFDVVAGNVTFYKNNASQGVIGGITGEKFPCLSIYNGSEQATTRFLSAEWTYAAPTGYVQLPFAMDVHIFNDAGARIARDFLWSFQGV